MAISSIGLLVFLDITIKKIVEEHTSVSRFGDGELKWMLGESPGYKFQKNDKS